MIRSLVARFTLMTLAVAGCGPSSQPAVSGADEAASTLAAAKARAQDLANSSQSYQPVRFVSEIEQSGVPRPVKRPEPADVVREGQETVPVDVTPVPSIATEDAAPAVHVDSTTESNAPRVPSVIPREAPPPPAVVGGSGEWRGADPGPDMGTVIGVVLRGGRVDPGHCPRHPRPPSQIPNRIPRR